MVCIGCSTHVALPTHLPRKTTHSQTFCLPVTVSDSHSVPGYTCHQAPSPGPAPNIGLYSPRKRMLQAKPFTPLATGSSGKNYSSRIWEMTWPLWRSYSNRCVHKYTHLCSWWFLLQIVFVTVFGHDLSHVWLNDWWYNNFSSVKCSGTIYIHCVVVG